MTVHTTVIYFYDSVFQRLYGNGHKEQEQEEEEEEEKQLHLFIQRQIVNILSLSH
jgi:hypothetical protein